MSFHENSAWACLLSTVAIWGAYFAVVLTLPAEASGVALPVVVAAIVLQAVLLIVAHAGFALFSREGSGHDERDRAIALRSAAWAGVVLSVGVFLCAVLFPMRELAQFMDPPGRLATGALAGPFATANLLPLCFVFSEAIHYGAQVVPYRRS